MKRVTSEFVLIYNKKLRSLKSDQNLRVFGRIPVKRSLNGTLVAASLNNVSFVLPEIGLLKPHNFDINGGIGTTFLDGPPMMPRADKFKMFSGNKTQSD